MKIVLLRPIRLLPPLQRRAIVTELLMVALIAVALAQWVYLHRVGSPEAVERWLNALGYVPAPCCAAVANA